MWWFPNEEKTKEDSSEGIVNAQPSEVNAEST